MSGNPDSSKPNGKIQDLSDEFGLVACLDYKIGFNGEAITDRKRDSLTGEITTRDLLLKNRFSPAQRLFANVLRKAGGFDTLYEVRRIGTCGSDSFHL